VKEETIKERKTADTAKCGKEQQEAEEEERKEGKKVELKLQRCT